MLDSINHTAKPTPAVVPDPNCLAAGDAHLDLAVRCYAAAIMSDDEIDRRVLDRLGIAPEPELERHTAAWAVARHAVWSGLPSKRIARLLGRLSIWLPGSPDEPDTIAAIIRSAIQEVSP